jgi:hypothetical protein
LKEHGISGSDAVRLRKTIPIIVLILAMLFSVLARTSQADFWSPNFSVYGNTTIYGVDTNATITIDLPLGSKANNVTVAFTLKIFSSIEAPAGNVVNSTQYLTEHSQNLFDCYLSSGFILDYDRAKIIDTLWLSWSKSGNETYEKEYNELLRHSYDTVLSQTADSYYGNTVLPKLSEGTHNLTVWVRAEQNYLSWDNPIWAAFSDILTFNIDTTAPKVSVLSPRDSLYNISDVPLNFTISEPFSKTTYSLDGHENVTIGGNTTLTGLPNGNHYVTIYATDKAGNVASETISFSVEVPFPAVPVAAVSAATIAVVSVALLVYFRKRRH